MTSIFGKVAATVDPTLDALFNKTPAADVVIPATTANVFAPAPVLIASPMDAETTATTATLAPKRKLKSPATTTTALADDQAAEAEGPRKKRWKSASANSTEPQEKLERTVFVGNVPVAAAKSTAGQRALKKLFKAHGEVESIRFRSIGFDKPVMGSMRKVAFLNGKFHEERDAMNAYVVYKESASVTSACTALNATTFEGNHLRVDRADKPKATLDHKRAVFVGNLPFTVKDESLWSIFAICGEVTSVRCVRDQATSIGKGFAYVEFRDRSSVSLALELNGSEHIGRKLRVTKCAQEGTVPKGRKEKSATANGGKGSKSAKSAASAPLDQKKPLRKTFEGERAGKIKLKHKSSSSGGGGKFKKGSSMRK